MRTIYIIVERHEDENFVTFVTANKTKARQKLFAHAYAEGVAKAHDEKAVLGGGLCGFSDNDYTVELFAEEVQ